MKKILINILCGLIPSRKLRHRLRKPLLKTKKSVDEVVGELGVEVKKAVSEMALEISNTLGGLQATQILLSRQIEAAFLHPSSIGKYKNTLVGREVVLIATGPTAARYKPIPMAIHMGCNQAFLYKDIKLDFFMSTDYVGVRNFSKEFEKYAIEDDSIKLIGHTHCLNDEQYPEGLTNKMKNVRRFVTTYPVLREAAIEPFLDKHPIWHGTIAHQLIQFILWTNPQRVYLVGCDCTGSKHSIEAHQEYDYVNSSKLQEYCWHRIKEFADVHYPETEIVSINPVGLKGLFRDVYHNN